jgi:hypothetical protein
LIIAIYLHFTYNSFLCFRFSGFKVTKRRVVFLEKKVRKQQNELTELRQFKRVSSTKSHKEKLVTSVLSKSFTADQTKILVEGKKRAKNWGDDDIINGLLLRSFSRKAFQFIRHKNLLPLPSLSTLKVWVKKLNCQPGMQFDILKIMKSKIEAETSPLAKLAALSFDEMEVAKCFDYDQETDRVLGPHKKLQLAMIRGICQNWKQPIFYDFDSQMKADLLFQIIISIESHGIQVWTIVFDLGNVGLLNELGVNPEKPFFLNPFDPTRPIFVNPDAPHMLKLLRNHLLDQGFQLDGFTITRRDLEGILAFDNSELKICHKLTETHFDVKGSARQNVRTAAQLLSHSTATALKQLFPEKEKQSDFVEAVNNWFDVMNSRLEFDSNQFKCAYGVHLEEQRGALEKMLQITVKMRAINRKGLLPFQKGIIIGIRSIIQLYQELSARFEVRYLRTVCENQDITENFFSRVRALGITYTHPGPVACKNRIRLLILGKDADIIIRSSSVQMDALNTPNLTEDQSLLTHQVTSRAGVPNLGDSSSYWDVRG